MSRAHGTGYVIRRFGTVIIAKYRNSVHKHQRFVNARVYYSVERYGVGRYRRRDGGAITLRSSRARKRHVRVKIRSARDVKNGRKFAQSEKACHKLIVSAAKHRASSRGVIKPDFDRKIQVFAALFHDRIKRRVIGKRSARSRTKPDFRYARTGGNVGIGRNRLVSDEKISSVRREIFVPDRSFKRYDRRNGFSVVAAQFRLRPRDNRRKRTRRSWKNVVHGVMRFTDFVSAFYRNAVD